MGRDTPRIQAHPFFRVIAHSIDLEMLTDDELIEFARFINSTGNLASANFYKGSRPAVEAIIDKFDRLSKKNDLDTAMSYASEKRGSLLNIFGRTYIPNLRLQVELGYIEMTLDEDNQFAQLEVIEGSQRED